jgi:hypothetical protein
MPDNVIGFGPGDWIEVYVAILLLIAAWAKRRGLERRFRSLASNAKGSMALLFVLPIVLRLLLLPRHPVPVPDVYDEFSHLLVADTLLHFRLANPLHPMRRFFETFFVLQEPTYSSIYPLGQGMMLALGRAVSGLPWTGVLLVCGAFCATCYWTLRAYVEPTWALAGGFLAVMQFGPLSLWTNCYWGGLLPAFAGCLIFGALPRLALGWKQGAPGRRRDAVLLGIGFSLHMLTRQFESVLLAGAIVLFALPFWRRWRVVLRCGVHALLALVPAVLLILLHNHAVTQHWLLLPEQLSQYQYGVPTTLTIQAPAAPHVTLTPQQALDYRAQALTHGPEDHDSWSRFWARMEYRVRNYRFFYLPPLYLAAVAFLFAMRRRRILLWVAATLMIFALGTNLFPYLLAHYLAAVTCLFVLVAVIGLRQITSISVRGTQVGGQISRVLLLLCGAQFLFWYGVHLLEPAGAPLSLLQYETWDFINHAGNIPRVAVNRQFAAIPGKLLVFVHYAPNHIYQKEWVWNRASIDDSRIVFARDLGDEENAQLRKYYPDRKVYLLEPDLAVPKLTEQ